MSIPLLVLASLLGGGRPAVSPAKATAPAVVTSIPDAELRALRAKYVGKEVWVYGGGPLYCSLTNPKASVTLSVPYTHPVRILNLERLNGTFPVAPVKSRRVLPSQPVRNPLRLRMELPKNFQVNTIAYSGTKDATLKDAYTCHEVTETYTDAADLEKNFSLTPPDASTKKALAPFLKPDSQNSPSELGLTHEQVLWLRGIPDEPRDDLNMLMKAQQWVWLGPPGYGDNVLHFQNDRVVKVEVPRMGP